MDDGIDAAQRRIELLRRRKIGEWTVFDLTLQIHGQCRACRGTYRKAFARQRKTDMAPDEAVGAGDEDRPQRSSSDGFTDETSSTIRRCSPRSASVPLRSSTLSAELNSADSAPRFSRVRSASSGSMGRIA